LKLLLQNIERQQDGNVICSVTDKKGTILYANEKFCKISGYSADELVGANHNIINSGLHSPSFFKEMWKTIASGNIWQGEIRNKTKDNRYYWVDTIIFPIHSTDSEESYFSVRTLIDDKKNAEFRKEQRINELENLIFTISYEMRQPISQILGLMHLLSHENQLPTELKQLINYLNNSASQLDTHTRKMIRQVEHIASHDKIVESLR
jgi:PAS domain S-box-containing protein